MPDLRCSPFKQSEKSSPQKQRPAKKNQRTIENYAIKLKNKEIK
jgi:hypothetical protein